jgi:hypothetical protein
MWRKVLQNKDDFVSPSWIRTTARGFRRDERWCNEVRALIAIVVGCYLDLDGYFQERWLISTMLRQRGPFLAKSLGALQELGDELAVRLA